MTDPLHDPLYQYQFAPVPNKPPAGLNVVDEPVHTDEEVAEIEFAATEIIFKVIVVLTHAVVLQVLSALT